MSGNMHFTLEKVAELRALLGDADPDLIHDTLEGQTDVFEIVDWLLGKLADEEAMQEAIASRIEALAVRKQACGGRIERLRQALLSCMLAVGEKSLRRPEATVSVASRKPGIQAIDETVLPDRFFKTERKVNRADVGVALKDGEVVPGVTLDNGGISLTVRRK